MAWKRCSGCSRAIAAEAGVCTYCGRQYVEDPGTAPRIDNEVPEDLFDVDALFAEGTIFEAATPIEDMDPFDASIASLEAIPSEERAHHGGPTDHISNEPEPVHAPALVADAGLLAQHVDAGEPVPAPAAAVPAAAPKRKPLAMAGVGLAAGAVLVVSLLGMRGAASPESVGPQPAAPKPVPAARPATAVRTTPAPVADPLPQWARVTDGRWVGPSRKSLAIELPAVRAVHVWTRDVKPLLVVRCVDRSTDVFVYTQSAARMEPQDGDHTVRLTLDDGGEVSERWPDSEEHDALFARDGAAFAQRLMRARTLRFGFTPHNADPVVARFEVAGLAELLEPAARECGWKSGSPRVR